MSSNFIKEHFVTLLCKCVQTNVTSYVKIILLNGFKDIFNKTITCIVFQCVVITVVQLFNIFFIPGRQGK